MTELGDYMPEVQTTEYVCDGCGDDIPEDRVRIVPNHIEIWHSSLEHNNTGLTDYGEVFCSVGCLASTIARRLVEVMK